MKVLICSFKRLFILIALIHFLPFLSNAQNNVLLYNGNAFYWSDAHTDTSQVMDPETREIVWNITTKEAAFTKMNQEPIYNGTDKETIEPVFKYGTQNETKYFQTLFKRNEFLGIPSFWIEKMVINKAGKPVYFEIRFDDDQNTQALKEKWGNVIEKSIKNMPYWQPGLYKGNPVLFYLNNPLHIASIGKSL